MTPLYIFDLDGTLADGSHRVHLIERAPKQWDEYFRRCGDDKPIEPTIRTLNMLLDAGANVHIWSGRNAMVLDETVGWIWTHVGPLWAPEYGNLRMRPEKDHRPDDELKRLWLDELSAKDRARLVAAFDDRDRVVAMWRAAGVPCYQVAPGDF